MAKVTIGVPTNRQIRPLTVQSLLELVAQNPDHSFHIVIETEGITIEDNRNAIAQAAVDNGSEYLLFIDDDMLFKPSLLEDFLKHNKMVVGVNSKTRAGGNTVKLEGIRASLVPTIPFSCRAVGTGLMLINTKVFSEFKRPWFKITRLPNGEPKEGEDVSFCYRVKELGHEIWCDPTLETKHIGDRLN